MKFFRLILLIFPFVFIIPTAAQDEDYYLYSDQVPAYSGDEASEFEQRQMEELEEEEAQLDSFGEDKYNENVDPEYLNEDHQTFPEEEVEY